LECGVLLPPLWNTFFDRRSTRAHESLETGPKTCPTRVALSDCIGAYYGIGRFQRSNCIESLPLESVEALAIPGVLHRMRI
jgi:hypothetical protein